MTLASASRSFFSIGSTIYNGSHSVLIGKGPVAKLGLERRRLPPPRQVRLVMERVEEEERVASIDPDHSGRHAWCGPLWRDIHISCTLIGDRTQG